MTDFGLSVARRFCVGITSVLRRCAAVGLLAVFSVSASQGVAETQDIFGALVLERCLPSVSTGRALPTKELKKLSRNVDKRFVGDAPGRVYAPDAPFLVLHGISANACSVPNFQADPRAISAFSDEWFGAESPFKRIASEGRVSSVLKRTYRGVINTQIVTVFVSTSADREFGILTIMREP